MQGKRPGRALVKRNRRSRKNISSVAEGFVYDPTSERRVRRASPLAALKVRGDCFLWAYLVNEAFGQCASEQLDRRLRRDMRGATQADDEWSGPLVDTSGPNVLRIALYDTTWSDETRAQAVAQFVHGEAGVTMSWRGLSSAVSQAPTHISEPSDVLDAARIARDVMRRTLAFLGRVDPYGSGAIEFGRSA